MSFFSFQTVSAFRFTRKFNFSQYVPHAPPRSIRVRETGASQSACRQLSASHEPGLAFRIEGLAACVAKRCPQKISSIWAVSVNGSSAALSASSLLPGSRAAHCQRWRAPVRALVALRRPAPFQGFLSADDLSGTRSETFCTLAVGAAPAELPQSGCSPSTSSRRRR